MKRCQKFGQGPTPHLDKIQKDSRFSRETVPNCQCHKKMGAPMRARFLSAWHKHGLPWTIDTIYAIYRINCGKGLNHDPTQWFPIWENGFLSVLFLKNKVSAKTDQGILQPVMWVRVWHLASRLLGIETFPKILSLGLSLKNIRLEKRSQSWSQKFWPWKKSQYLSRKFWSKKRSLGLKILVSK